MNKSHISQKSPITACFWPILGLLACFAPAPLKAYTQEAEAVLGNLQESVATGLLGESEYSAFLSQLEEEDGCESWAQNPSGFSEDVWKELLGICPDLEHASTRSSAAYSTWSVSQSVKPRMPSKPAPFLMGEYHTPLAGVKASFRDLSLNDRRMVMQGEGFELQAGQMHPALSATGLEFVVGSRFYAGWSGHSGFSGPLASPKAALDGLSLSFQGAAWRFQAAGAWNRIQNKGTPILAESEAERKDALLYLLGLARKNLVFQMAHQRFESAAQPSASVTILGGAMSGLSDYWRMGMAGSVWSATHAATGSSFLRPGLYGEASVGKAPSSQLEISQASPEWSNPLQSPHRYRQDTLEGQWLLPGRGEGGLHGRSLIPIFALGLYQVDIRAGSDITWVLGTTGLLAAQSRLAVIQNLGNWGYSCGTDALFRRSRSLQSVPNQELAGGGIGHILLWHNTLWKARASLIQRRPGYRGPYLEPLGLSLERGIQQRQIRKIKAELFFGDIKKPAGYSRFCLSQEWEMGRGVLVTYKLRLPWSQEEGWKKDLGYQFGLTMEL